jgi:hypothetical protein
MKKILIINGHPNPSSFNFALADIYKKGAIQSKAQVENHNYSRIKIQSKPPIWLSKTNRIRAGSPGRLGEN